MSAFHPYSSLNLFVVFPGLQGDDVVAAILVIGLDLGVIHRGIGEGHPGNAHGLIF